MRLLYLEIKRVVKTRLTWILLLAAIKIVSALLIGSVCFLACGIIWILVTNSLFGWESTKTSMQMLFTISRLQKEDISID